VSNYLTFAKETAREAGQVLIKGFRKKLSISRKGEIDLVTQMDLKAEKIIQRTINKTFPNHSILAEEGGLMDRGSGHRWIVDPLDGTTNYAHGYPVWCVSIALEVDGEVVVGVVYDPNRDEMFYGSRDRGAFMNRKRLSVSGETNLADSFLATGFPYDIRDTRIDNLDHFANLYKKCRGVRRGGSAALDLAYTASGVFDGFWELKLSAWDVAAGVLLVREAGGIVTGVMGQAFSLHDASVVCANSTLHREMLGILELGKRPKAKAKPARV